MCDKTTFFLAVRALNCEVIRGKIRPRHEITSIYVRVYSEQLDIPSLMKARVGPRDGLEMVYSQSPLQVYVKLLVMCRCFF